MSGPLTKPNIIWIMTDDQPVLTSDETQAMPYLNSRPYGSWVRFPNAVLTTPLCGVARANLLSGQRWDHHGVRGNLDASDLDETKVLPVWLKAAGYRTALVGKYLNEYPFGGINYIPQDWDYWFANRGENQPYYNWEAVQSDNTTYVAGNTAVDYTTDALRDRASIFLDTALASDQPWFLYFPTIAPHDQMEIANRHKTVPITLPPDSGDLNQADVTGFPSYIANKPVMTSAQINETRTEEVTARRTLRAVDEAIQTLLEKVAAAGQINNTVIIFQTDNGRAIGRKRLSLDTASMDKRAPYYYAADPQLWVRYPGAPQRTETGLIRTIDMTATVAAWAGATPNLLLDGYNATRLVMNGEDIHDTIEYTYHGNAEVSGIPQWWAVRTSKWKYIEWTSAYNQSTPGIRQLFDLEADPFEQVSLYDNAQYASVVSDLSSKLASLKADPNSLILPPPTQNLLSVRGRSVASIRSGGQARNISQIRRPT